MDYLSQAEFRQHLLSRPLADIVTDLVFKGIPYVFRDNPELFQTLTGHLCDRLSLIQENVTVIGSAKLGFSLAPDTFPAPFSETSDIDVLVVDEKLYDDIWYSLLEWHYYRDARGLNTDERRWVGETRKRLYWGWIYPDDLVVPRGIYAGYLLRPVRDLRTRWFDAFRSLSRYPPLARRDISGRLYRTWKHAHLYHVDSLEQLKTRLASPRRS